MTQDRDTIRFNALRNALYHTARRRSLDRLNRIFNFMIVVLGAAAVGDIVTRFNMPDYLLGMTVAVIGALQLVFDFGRQARDHQVLQRDYYGLLADLEAKLDPTEEDLAIFQSRLTRFAAEEQPILRAIDSKAYNDAIGGLGIHSEGERLVIPFMQRIFGGLFAYEGHFYIKHSEQTAVRAARLNKS